MLLQVTGILESLEDGSSSQQTGSKRRRVQSQEAGVLVFLALLSVVDCEMRGAWQWQIQNFPEGGANSLFFCQKLHEIERSLRSVTRWGTASWCVIDTQSGIVPSVCPRSTTVKNNKWKTTPIDAKLIIINHSIAIYFTEWTYFVADEEYFETERLYKRSCVRKIYAN